MKSCQKYKPKKLTSSQITKLTYLMVCVKEMLDEKFGQSTAAECLNHTLKSWLAYKSALFPRDGEMRAYFAILYFNHGPGFIEDFALAKVCQQNSQIFKKSYDRRLQERERWHGKKSHEAKKGFLRKHVKLNTQLGEKMHQIWENIDQVRISIFTKLKSQISLKVQFFQSLFL